MKPALGRLLADDGEDVDFGTLDVIEDAKVADAKPVLRPTKAAETLDTAAADLGRGVAEVNLELLP